MLDLRRREFITLLGGAAAAWPLAARAQQAAVPVVGFLTGAGADLTLELDAFWQGLTEARYSEGRNVAIEYRSAEGEYDRMPALAADLVRRQVAVIVATGGTATALAAKTATTTIPIVIVSGGDPVALGLVASFNRPGGNVTGVSFQVNRLGAKRVQLLHELVPTAAQIGFLVNPANPNFESETRDVQVAARELGQQVQVLNALSEHDIDAAFASLVQRRLHALIVAADAFLTSRRDQLIRLAERHAVPTVYAQRVVTAAGGLMSYGVSLTEAHRLAGTYAARILKGAKPADLPIEQPAKFELVINLKTAKALGLTVPLTLQAAADEVIE